MGIEGMVPREMILEAEAQEPQICTRVLIADDHELVRHGLKALLETEEGYEVCGEAASGREAVKMAIELKPDVAVLDISMPGLNGLEAARRIRKACVKTQILVLTMHDSEQLAQALLDAGALGYVLKSDISRDLAAGVDSVRRQRPFFTTRVARMVLTGFLKGVNERTAETSAPAGSLTPREREIVQLIAEGKSNKEIAAFLNISVKTAETHRANLMRKLDVHSVSDIVHYAARNEIIEP